MFFTTNTKYLKIFISAIESQNGNRSFHLTRPKRQSNSDPKTHLDAQITYLLGALPFQIDLAEETIEKNVKFLVFKKLTWGWAVVVGGLFDFYSDFVLQNRTMGNFGDITTWWGYGSTGFYAVGFGFPYILGLQEDNLPCHSSDFKETLEQYKLSNGLDELFATSLPISAVRAILSEFDAWVRIKIACITDSEGNYIEAAEVSYLLDELNAAMSLRIDVEDAEREKEKEAEKMAEPVAESSRRYDNNFIPETSDSTNEIDFEIQAGDSSSSFFNLP